MLNKKLRDANTQSEAIHAVRQSSLFLVCSGGC